MKSFDEIYEKLKRENEEELNNLINSFNNARVEKRNAMRIAIIIIAFLVTILLNILAKIFNSNILSFINVFCILLIFIEICLIINSIRLIKKRR